MTWGAGIPRLRAPHLAALPKSHEAKTDPQHSVRELRSIGILPDMIVARSDYPVEKALCAKIAQFCDVPAEAVIPLETADLLYRIPLVLEEMRVAEILLDRLNLGLTGTRSGEVALDGG